MYEAGEYGACHKCVIYWPLTEPSIKRCTCVNKRKNSGSRWTLGNDITRYPAVRVRWRQDAEVRTSLQTEGFAALSDPWLSNPSQDAKEVLLWLRKNLGLYSRLSLSPLISHTQQTSPFSKIKCERFIFF